MTLNIVFAGTPEFARVSLAALVDLGPQYDFKVSLVLTQPDRPAGRGMKLQASPVKQWALEHGLRVAQPLKMADLDADSTALIAQADVMVVAAYGLILPQAVLDLPRWGCINIHASLLPRWRGAAPIHRAIEAGDPETGVCIMQMEAGLDTGPVLLRETLAIQADDTTASLHDKLAALGARLCVQALGAIETLRPQAQAQADVGISYAHKISKDEATIDWSQSAEVLARKVRALNPFPGCSTRYAGNAIKIWAAQLCDTTLSVPAHAVPGQIVALDAGGIVVACGQGVLRLTQLQRAGAKRLSAAEFCKGFALRVGDTLEN